MDLAPYLDTVRQGVTGAAALGDDTTRQVAERLGGAVESSTRLALIRALADAAAEISAEVAPSSVELRMIGADPELVVVVPEPAAEPTLLLPDEPAVPGTGPGETAPGGPAAGETTTDTDDATGRPIGSDAAETDDDEVLARISLRLPSSVKARVDERADRDGLSTNAWLLRAVLDALDERPRVPEPPTPPQRPEGGGPFGPYGVFGPHGPFGPGGVFGSIGRNSPGAAGPVPGRRGTVQGWVR